MQVQRAEKEEEIFEKRFCYSELLSILFDYKFLIENFYVAKFFRVILKGSLEVSILRC